MPDDESERLEDDEQERRAWEAERERLEWEAERERLAREAQVPDEHGDVDVHSMKSLSCLPPPVTRMAQTVSGGVWRYTGMTTELRVPHRERPQASGPPS